MSLMRAEMQENRLQKSAISHMVQTWNLSTWNLSFFLHDHIHGMNIVSPQSGMENCPLGLLGERDWVFLKTEWKGLQDVFQAAENCSTEASVLSSVSKSRSWSVLIWHHWQQHSMQWCTCVMACCLHLTGCCQFLHISVLLQVGYIDPSTFLLIGIMILLHQL